MKILVTGCDGYIGWPLIIKLCLDYPKAQIIGIDNLARRKWVKEVKSKSKLKIATMSERCKELKKFGVKNFKFINLDLTSYPKTDNLIKKFKPNFILHLAAQPSAPYANSNYKRSFYTSFNNNTATLNLLWSMKSNKLYDTIFVETTTTGVYGAPKFKIPEGFLKIKNEKIIYPGLGGSWYHITKCNDINYLYLAYRNWGLKIIDFRTAITLGTATKETKLSTKFATRYDSDFYFGVVPNRFVDQAIKKENITIYGKGEQKKPFIHLQDAVDSLANILKIKKNDNFKIINQFSETVSIKQIAHYVKKIASKNNIKIKHIKNPRVEDEKHKMRMENKLFKKILNRKITPIVDGLKATFEDLNNQK